MDGRTFLRMLLTFSLLGFAFGLVLPVLIENLPYIDEHKAQKRAENVVRQAAKWYLIQHGPPDETMGTEQVKQVLIPDYLNKWPGHEPIECIIEPDGEVIVYTKEKNRKEKDWFLLQNMLE